MYNKSDKDYYEQLAHSLKCNKDTYTSREEKVVCPYCGCVMEDDDGYFVSEGSGELECEECGKTFRFCSSVYITYSTYRME